jgi:hypothetical protein
MKLLEIKAPEGTIVLTEPSVKISGVLYET